MYAPLAFISLIFEAGSGYPQALFRTLGHPVSWIGRMIARCERMWNHAHHTFRQRQLAGILTLAICLGVAGGVSIVVVWVIDLTLPTALGLILSAIVASTLIAQRSLHDHVGAVARALETNDIGGARAAVSMIVGRDTATLGEHAISRAAIESLSENFSDGIVAPIFWMVVAGLPGAALYKTINTADSMIGHKSVRYVAFGWAAARLDDVVNLPASRLSAIWIAAAGAVLPDVSGRDALKAIRSDASKHRSPNAGWPEAAMAGALGLGLAGPRVYKGVVVDDHWMGNGRTEATAADIRRALRVYRTACLIQACAVALLAMAVRI